MSAMRRRKAVFACPIFHRFSGWSSRPKRAGLSLEVSEAGPLFAKDFLGFCSFYRDVGGWGEDLSVNRNSTQQTTGYETRALVLPSLMC